ncbi:hypothetical protein T01_11311 [Trichinella spiralis]|uniref:Uncharacterized protein n=1 Tax=Trichinella spiralis TaxID=6334 RepID=A0A0V1B0D9_TRISP|nr:hypothetical protein T01_11311 [Trichinella spiralis]
MNVEVSGVGEGRFMQIFNRLGAICKFLFALRLCLRQNFKNFEFFYNIAPGFSPRLCPRANKNLHMPSRYAQGILLHNI